MTLTEIGLKHETDKAFHHKFTDFYERELKGIEIKSILEIGVMDGASLRMWMEFYPQAEVIGVDIIEKNIEGLTTIHGDATDPELINSLGMFDLIIDDGSHMTADQIKSYELLKTHLNKGGVYICEDVHTSYRPTYVNSETAVDYFTKLGFTFFWKNDNDKTDSGTCLKKC